MRKRIGLIVLSISGMGYGQEAAPAPVAQAPVAEIPAGSENKPETPAPSALESAAPVPSSASAPADKNEPVATSASEPAPVPTSTETTPAASETLVEVLPAQAPVVPAAETSASSEQPVSVEQPAAEGSTPAASETEPASEEEESVGGIDTVDVNEPQGNWLYKRIWWEKAERLYEKIKRLADQIAEMRTQFFTRRNDLDRSVLDPFYLHIGLDQGELQQTLAYFMEQMQEERKEMGSLNEQERDLLSKAHEEKKTLEQLNTLVQAVSNVDHTIDDALGKLIEQINLARDYEKRAWENFKSINRQLSDKAARELYYGMDNSWRNLNTINSYIADAFSKHFDQLVHKVGEDTENVKAIMRSLKEKGIDLKAQAQRLRKPATQRHEQKEETAEEEHGWLGWLWSMVTAPFRYTWYAVSAPFVWAAEWFMGSEEAVEVARPEKKAASEPAAAEEA